ncbi:MAG: HlyD family type I secretion periplasmic adaptor subunit [Hyphomicrobium sp.]|nr:HlyD family type I secretion periplasmic adaptor subunit [Hyphomicrobium sp.]
MKMFMKSSGKIPRSKAKTGVAAYMLIGLAVSFLLIGGIGVWAATTEISGAVIAPGLVVVESNIKKVQHPTGGVVGEIYVKNGAKVEGGNLLLRLDETVTRANHQAVVKQLTELLIREQRLKAERDDVEAFKVPAELEPRVEETDIAEIIRGEESLLKTRRSANEGAKSQLGERVRQLEDERKGIEAQINAKTREIELIAKELESLLELEVKQLVTSAKMAALRREKARLEGELGQYMSAAAQTGGRIAEIRYQTVRIDQEFKTEVVRELREIQSKIAELTERRIAAEDQLKRVEIRAPHAGIVHQLTVHTVGGVVNPGEPIMMIVPEDDRLVVETKISPMSIDQLHVGQLARVRFTAFNHNTTPELEGELLGISADLTRDQNTGEAYYTARVGIGEDQLKRLEGKHLLPGMPADVQIRTQDRTALSYLMKPVTDQFARAFRER